VRGGGLKDFPSLTDWWVGRIISKGTKRRGLLREKVTDYSDAKNKNEQKHVLQSVNLAGEGEKRS